MPASTRQQSEERQALAASPSLTRLPQDRAQFAPALSVKTELTAYDTAPTQGASSRLLRQHLGLPGSTRALSGLLPRVRQFRTGRDGDIVSTRSVPGRATLFMNSLTDDMRVEHLPQGGVHSEGLGRRQPCRLRRRRRFSP
ncbi:hypothetical protein KME66_13240 [Streptomyces sp. YPW6]|uniref:hypothetical protein n=1 Tax=Streptomyces sp. YPW6 TaxID=2840373 RepID=UPI001C0CA9A5|nr:hypothetical protein [Streptomyces sp. YPW6]QWQ41861.1 hypothetical protein KME66_13240 [Streptomyces sp. YPW6]